ncbi:integrase [Paraburkholderia azotifigens]|uniref:Site-specific integrase n=1 Tax=Paraburkholderia azotifigens TaxID=2057004 RepID=A0A5C6VLV0_9BURK|nr:site-specific integrase [Paraburkholderia azotifigens]TXC86452.1 site-specific integrase [Paraburkholderia azotifigens]
MATITERRDARGNTTFQARIRRAGYPPLSRTFPGRMQAELWATAIDGELDQREAQRAADIALRKVADAAPPDRLTLGDLLLRYRDRVTPGKRAAIEEGWRIRGLLGHPLARCPVVTLAPPQVAEWRDWRLKSVTGSTVKRDLTLLRHVIEIARIEWGIKLDSNPFTLIRQPRENPPRERRLNGDEEYRLIQACDGASRYMQRLIVLALETAMRRSEIVGLEWERIDFQRSRILLDRTKTGVSRHVIPSTRAVNELLKIRHELQAWARARRCEVPPRVFPGLTPNAVGLCFERTVRRAGIHDLRFHDLRHEAISRMFEKGLTVMEVAQISGHQTLQMLKRYTHLQMGDLARRLDRKPGGA